MNYIKEIISILHKIPAHSGPKIGIGITEHNRYEIFKNSYENILKYAPPGAEIVVVDDASDTPVPEATYRFKENVGIARAKNMCLSLLYQRGCEHFFLLDSDTYPLSADSWTPYIESHEPHLMYIFENFASGKSLNDTFKLYQDSKIVAFSHPRGCMLYYHRSALDKVGGMDPIFGKWGYEHPSHSDRIFMAGLTSFRYMDIVNSAGLWYSDDEQTGNKNTTVEGEQRQKLVETNSQLYKERRYTSNYIPFIEKKNILLTCYFSNVSDPQRGNRFPADNKALQALIKSLKHTQLVVLHDCLNEKDTPKVKYIKVETSINPYFQRWVSYRQYLKQHKDEIENVFCIDGTDIEVLKEPNWNDLGDLLYTGDEPTKLDDEGGWLKKNHQARAITSFINLNGNKYQLLNAGIVGGRLNIVSDFIRDLIDYWTVGEVDAHYHKYPNTGLTDMGAFNLIARTKYGDRLRYGREICTVFKANERNNYSWFKHK